MHYELSWQTMDLDARGYDGQPAGTCDNSQCCVSRNN
ncbi:hypothetical protein ABH911_005295 [Pseudomonas protegens]